MFVIVCTLALFERICSEDLLATFRSAASVPEKLTSLYEFDVDMPLRNSISGAADAVLVGATADIGVDSTDEGQIIVSKSGHIKVAPNVPPVAPYGRANNFTILLDARFSNMGKYTSLFQLQPENQDDGDAWFKIADGTFFGISAHGYIGVDDYRDNYCRFVVSIDNVNKVARYYVNGRLVIEAIGARCGGCVEDGKFSFGETILLFTDNDDEEADVRATTAAFWSESLSPNAVASLGPPSFGAADAPLCAAMDELGTFLIWGLPALSQSNPSSGIARCGNTCCRSDGMLPCRYRDARFQAAHGPSGECQLNPSKGVCSVGQQVSMPNVDKDGYGYFCSAHVSSPAPAMEPLIGFLGGSEPEHHLASTIAFHLSIKAFQNGIVIPRDEIHPSLLEIFAASMIARTSGSTSEPFIFSQQTAYEWGFAPGQRQRTAFLLAQNVTPVVSKNGSHFVMNTMADISVFRRDRQIPAPLAIITGSGIDYCGAVARAVEQGQKTAMVSSACAGSSMTTQVRSVSSGPSANCRQWKLLLGSLGISKFGVLWSRTRLESFYYETFNVLGIRSCLPQCRDRLAGTNGSLCLAMSVEVCSQILSSDTSSTCQAMADALKELRDADVRVILVGLEGRSVDYGEFFDETHNLGMTGGQYLWMFMADTTSSSPLPKMAFLQRPGFAEHFDGSLLLVNTCDGSKWEQLQEYLNTLTADEFPDGLMNSEKKVPGGATYGVLSDATEGFAQYSWYFQESIDAFIARTVDATWALLLALNSLVRRYGHALYELRPSMILAEMDQLDFLGVCGHVRWVGGSRSTATPIRVYNVRHVNESFEAVFFAGQMYNFVADPLAKVNDSGIMWYQEPRYFANSTSPPLHLPPDCKAGQESRHDLQCHPCPAGEYSPVAGRGIKCISCQPGHYNGALGQKSCSACPSGRYQSTVGQTGFYLDDIGQAACKPCEKGRYLEFRGGTECTMCPPGEYASQNGSSSCDMCPEGFFTSTYATTECTICAKGTYLNNPRGTQCKRCDDNLVSSPGHVQCNSCAFLRKPTLDRDACEIDAMISTAFGISIILFLGLSAYIFMKRRQKRSVGKALRSLLADKKMRKDIMRLERAVSQARKFKLNTLERDLRKQLLIQSRKYVDLQAFEQIVEEADMKLLRGAWLVDATTSGTRMKRHQDILEDHFWDPQQFHSQSGALVVVAISYCWLHHVHPDPRGLQLSIIRQALNLRMRVDGPGQVTGIALFLDYCSIAQKAEKGNPENPEEAADRTPEEKIAFKAGLESVNIPYASELTETWVLQWAPPDYHGPRYDQRAWPSFEKMVSSLVKHPSRLINIDDTVFEHSSWRKLFKQRMKRSPPYTPDAFRQLIAAKTVTNGSDLAILIDVYDKTFAEVIGNAQILWFVAQEWGDEEAEVLVQLFPFCHRVQEVLVSDNMFSSEGVLLLTKHACTCETLLSLDVAGNDIDSDIVPLLKQMWTDAGKPSKGLYLKGGRNSTYEMQLLPSIPGKVDCSARVEELSVTPLGLDSINVECDTNNVPDERFWFEV